MLIDPNQRVAIPLTHLPSARTTIAVQKGVERKLLFRTWGGIGDQICAEPTLRFALDSFKNCEVYLASEMPEIFSHLRFKDVFDIRSSHPFYGNYLLLDTIVPPDESNLVWQFFNHMVTNCVDFPSLCAIRCQVPVSYKRVHLSDKDPGISVPQNAVFVHPGKHWQSKTFPKAWWDEVLNGLISLGCVPVIIGANSDDNRGTVDVETRGCVDLRNKTNLLETIWLLKRARVLLTNDSAPIHMAAAGEAWIGYVATCKHPDYITHWREGEFGWRMRNFGRGGIWDVMDYSPNKEQTVSVESVPQQLLESWLPEPMEIAQWAEERA